MTKNKVLSLVVVTMVVLALATGCSTLGQTSDMVRTISVSGTGSVKLTPDIASFSVAVSELADTTAEAQAAVNAKMATLLGIIRAAGIDEKDISTTSLTFRPEYNWIDGKQELQGQRASQRLSVTIRGIDSNDKKLSSLIDQLGTVSGIEFTSVTFDRADKVAAYNEARELAVKKAEDKATRYASSSGMELGKPVSISESSQTNTPMYRTTGNIMMAEAAYDSVAYSTELPTGEIEVSVTIYLVYEMK